MLTIENSYLKVDVNEVGAEITHIIQKQDNFDYIWNGSEWKRHAPILFPAVGRSYQDKYSLDGQLFEMMQHGFARDYTWTTVDKGDDRVTLTLTQNEETKTRYPFDFALSVTYELFGNKVKTSYEVINNSAKPMPFALGSHPAFNIPINGDQLAFEDYQVTLSPEVIQIQKYELEPMPYRSGKIVDVIEGNGSVLPLSHELMDQGPIVIANQGLTAIKLSSPKSEHVIELSLEDFAYVTLWTKEEANAKFICLEPFNGLPDIEGVVTDWYEKAGNQILNPGEQTEFTYEITLS